MQSIRPQMVKRRCRITGTSRHEHALTCWLTDVGHGARPYCGVGRPERFGVGYPAIQIWIEGVGPRDNGSPSMDEY